MGDFKNLAVWQKAYALALSIYRATRDMPIAERFGLQSQLRRAAVSVVSNIAEGAGRGTDGMLANAVRIARGSLAEMECQLMLARDLGFVNAAEAAQLLPRVAEVSRMCLALVARLAPKR